MTQDHVVNPDLVLALYGPGKDGVKKSHRDKPAADPYYIWTGTCEGAVALRHKRAFVDLSGSAKLRWRTKQEGFRRLHIVVKLVDGKWFVSDDSVPESSDWQIGQMAFSQLRWRVFDAEKVVEGTRAKPDLTRLFQLLDIRWTRAYATSWIGS